MNLRKEKYYWQKGYQIIIGLDEAGRGSLAGPVAAAGVMINLNQGINKIKKQSSKQSFQEILKKTKDSKQLTPKQRENIFQLVKKSSLINFAYSFISAKTIDKININQATQKAMLNCLQKIIKTKIKNIQNKKILILIDGNQPLSLTNQLFKNKKIKQQTIVRGDDKVFSIALASVIAKTQRDQKMKKLALKYPQYQLDLHKGYGTKKHLQLLKKYGLSEIHRQSYKPYFIK